MFSVHLSAGKYVVKHVPGIPAAGFGGVGLVSFLCYSGLNAVNRLVPADLAFGVRPKIPLEICHRGNPCLIKAVCCQLITRERVSHYNGLSSGIFLLLCICLRFPSK